MLTGRRRAERTFLIVTAIGFAALLASGCAHTEDAPEVPASLGDVVFDSSGRSGVIVTGSYRVVHPPGWRFVACDPALSDGLALFGVSADGETSFALEEVDFTAPIDRSRVEALVTNRLDAANAEYERVELDAGLDTRLAFLVTCDESHAISVIHVFARRVVIASVSGPARRVPLDLPNATAVAAAVTLDTGPYRQRSRERLPALDSPDGSWSWIADTPAGIVLSGDLDGVAVEVSVEADDLPVADSPLESGGRPAQVYFTGSALYAAAASTPVGGEPLRVTLASDNGWYTVTIAWASEAGRRLTAEEVVASDDFRALVEHHLVLDAGGER